MYAQCYEMSRKTLPRGPAFLHHVLSTLKDDCPDHFHEALHIIPQTFDRIIDQIMDDPVFTNNSNYPQIALETQLAIALYRFGHNGNSVSLQSVANWAGVSKGMVHLVTCQVITAVLHPEFRELAVHFQTPSEKGKVKDWVQAHSCKAWRGEWCFVDGTLVLLSNCPYWYGENYFDRKGNYSLNIQV